MRFPKQRGFSQVRKVRKIPQTVGLRLARTAAAQPKEADDRSKTKVGAKIGRGKRLPKNDRGD